MWSLVLSSSGVKKLHKFWRWRRKTFTKLC